MVGPAPSLLPRLPGSYRAVIATCAGRMLAVDQAQVSAIGTIACSPPVPGGAPWLDGIGEHDGKAVLVVALFGCALEPRPERQSMVMVLDLGRESPLSADRPRISLRIDGAAGLAECSPRSTGERLSSACPAAWLRPCRLADGSDAVWVDGLAMRKSWEES
ncbi:hypothetical protein LBMAG53_06780 [Planctomycetota bacterium]|nr:hypothetical protein LBMAG53_06780 [Planctomycetota bacterium]